MGSSLDTVQYICDQAGLGHRLTHRRMFGEFALYLDGKVIALVCDDQLFLKPTAAGRAFLGPVPEAAPFPGAKLFPLLSAEMDDPERLAGAFEVTAAALPMPKPKAKKKSSSRQARGTSAAVPGISIRVKIQGGDGMPTIPVRFDPRTTFGKARPAVKVTLNGYTYRSTIFSMGGRTFIPLSKANLQGAGLDGGETLEVAIALDEEPRKVALPAELQKALRGSKALAARWAQLSYSSQREQVEAITGAKKPETRQRRLAKTLALLKG
ncbi:MAG: YdeI/OmpD-associated family protein [Steroidobacteraceae bacterium]